MEQAPQWFSDYVETINEKLDKIEQQMQQSTQPAGPPPLKDNEVSPAMKQFIKSKKAETVDPDTNDVISPAMKQFLKQNRKK